MIQFAFLTLNNFLYFILTLLLIFSSTTVIAATQEDSEQLINWDRYKKIWTDDIKFHGFVSQSLLHSYGNNIWGQSKNSISADLTEVGLNVYYQHSRNLSFAAQGLYRRAGALTGSEGEASLDYALVDYTLFQNINTNIGIRAGKIKNSIGIYNEARDVSFTHPTIFLPLIYFEKSRNILLSMTGGQVYAEHNTSWGDLSLEINYGLSLGKNLALLALIQRNPSTVGEFDTQTSFVTRFKYDFNKQYVFALSYYEINLDYESEMDNPWTGLNFSSQEFWVSTQYNAEKFSLTAEYKLTWTKLLGAKYALPDTKNVSDLWYIQAEYRLLDNLAATLRYDQTVADIYDSTGNKTQNASGGFYPAHFMYNQDISIGLRWDINQNWMLRGEYHHLHGASEVSVFDNANQNEISTDWGFYAMQISFRF